MVKLRLMRMGATKRPFYRVVVADSRSPRDGRFIENIGKYHPLEDPSLIDIDADRALYWLSQGAQPTGQVQKWSWRMTQTRTSTGNAPPFGMTPRIACCPVPIPIPSWYAMS